MRHSLTQAFRSLLKPNWMPADPAGLSSENPWGSAVNWRQYLHAGSPFAVTNPDWQTFVNAEGITIKSMLSLGEAALCFALARDYWTGAGEFADLGPLMGLSSHAFALGVRQNRLVKPSSKTRRVHCYDLFLTAQMPSDFLRTAPAHDCGSLFDEFAEFNREQLDLLSICPGDVLNMRWGHRPVEIAFIDLSKSLELNNWVVKSIFSRLLPGAYVIQQDLVYEQQWWVAATMEHFHRYFEIVDYCWGATGLFRLKTLSASELAGFHELCGQGIPKFDCRTWNDLLVRAEERHHTTTREMLRCARARMLAHFEKFDDAEAVLRTVTGAAVCDDAYRNFANIVPSAVERIRNQIESAKKASGR